LTGEAIGITTAVIIFAIVFGAVIAPLLPLAIGIAAIAVSLAAVALIGQIAPQQVFITNIISMLGLAFGIDYALFIVDRYREFRSNGSERRDAIELAGATASKAVVFSAVTVIFALAGLWIVPNNVFRSLGLGAVIVVAATVLVSLTLLPALLSLVGDRINWPRRGVVRAMGTLRSSDADAYHGFWGRLAQIVMARPIVSAVLATGLLIATALPVLNLNTGVSAGGDGLPPGSTRDAIIIVEDKFLGGAIAPVRVVFEGERATVEPIIAALTTSIDSTETFVPVSQPVIWDASGSVAILTATLAV
ncbi:MAG: MMPL family transporter, partial [Thermomicrobiales bacterium]